MPEEELMMMDAKEIENVHWERRWCDAAALVPLFLVVVAPPACALAFFLQAFCAVLASNCHLVHARFLDRTCHVIVHISFGCLLSRIATNDV